FCLDCVQACPRDNIGVIAVAPTSSIWRDGRRSGIGRLTRRCDYAALAAILVFGAFANAAGMIAPIVEFEQATSDKTGQSMLLSVTLFYSLSLIALPAICITGAAIASQRLGAVAQTSRELACRYIWSLVPLGFAMWMAHYSFH